MKAVSQRIIRVGESIRSVLAEAIITGSHHISEIDNKFITITEVIPSADLKRAKVYFGCLGKNQEKIAKTLNSFSGKLSTIVARNIKTKYSPRLYFYPDETYDKIKKIDNLISSANNK